MKILVCTDGSIGSIQPAELLAKFGLAPDTQFTVLGVSENIEHLENLAVSIDMIYRTLGPACILEKKVRNGNPLEEILAEAIETSYDLIAVGGGSKQIDFLHPRVGSTTSKLTRKLHTHFLVGRNVPGEIHKVLFCVGPESRSSRTTKLGGAWLSNTQAEISLLHVLPKVKSNSDEIGDAKEKAESTLRLTKKQLQTAGAKIEIGTRIRNGLVVDEVLKELSEGKYDLLVVGAHYQPGQDRWQGTLLDDVTDQLLNQASCSILII
jgi:nucleotide-binding universal stress UspA family protein